MSYKEIIEDLLKEYWNVETWSEEFEEIEHKSRDGFICASHNKGGYTLTGFSDIMSIVGSGCHPTNKEAREDIDRQYEYHMDCVAESTYENFEELFDKHGLTREQAYYHDIYNMSEKNEDFSEVLHFIENAEQEDTEMSVMYQLRVMYHGKKDSGWYHASVSAVVNTEGPYHRSGIGWSPNTFCEGGKEVEINYRNEKEFKRILEKTLCELVSKTF